MFSQHYVRDQRYQRVPVYLASIVTDNGRSVYICVEYYPKIGALPYHGLRKRLHGRRVLRIRGMVWEHAIRLQKLASRIIRAKAGQHLCGKKTTGSVSSIYYYVQALKRLAHSGILHYLVYEESGIILCQVCLSRPSGNLIHLDRWIYFGCIFKDFSYVRFFSAASFCKYLHSIMEIWKMACSYHNRSRTAVALHDCGHEHRRRRSHITVNYIYPAALKSPDNLRFDLWTRYPRIHPYSNPELVT